MHLSGRSAYSWSSDTFVYIGFSGFQYKETSHHVLLVSIQYWDRSTFPSNLPVRTNKDVSDDVLTIIHLPKELQLLLENFDCKAVLLCYSCWYNFISHKNKFWKSIQLIESNKSKNTHENSLVWDPVPFTTHIHYCLIIFVFGIDTFGKIPFEKQFCWTSWNRNLLYCSTQSAGLCGEEITSFLKEEAVINSVIKAESEGGIEWAQSKD